VNGRELSSANGQIEIVLIGPGYGESILVHIGNGEWIVVDSCIARDGAPAALNYLDGRGLDPSEAVRLIVTTHWHDDHIRGMGELVSYCANAEFCCASVLCREEFLALIKAYNSRPMISGTSGAKEIYKVISILRERRAHPCFAMQNRRVFAGGLDCEIWALSPPDAAFQAFLSNMGELFPGSGESKKHCPLLVPNRIAVVLWLKIEGTAILLGADLERSGWAVVLDSRERPQGKASVFKIPHHGSADAHEDRVWERMLVAGSNAILTPWRRGRGELPTRDDTRRILSFTERAYITAARMRVSRPVRRRDNAVERTLRESGATLCQTLPSDGTIRLHRNVGSNAAWKIETMHGARRLADYW